MAATITSLAVLLCFVLTTCFSQSVYQTAKPYVRHNQFRNQDTFGQYNYGFDSEDGIQRTEARTQEGGVRGGYSYTSPEGQVIDINYISGPQGYQAVGNAVPKAPALPAANIKALEDHFRAVAAAKARTPQRPEPEYEEPQYGPPRYLTYDYRFSS